ncbi:hypothetical protein LINGRAHAP2_LOCUS2986 [Linum grandiflorum]
MEMATTITKLFAVTLIICFLLVDLPTSSAFHDSEAAPAAGNPVNQVELSSARNLEMEMDYEKDPGANNKHLPPSTPTVLGVGG